MKKEQESKKVKNQKEKSENKIKGNGIRIITVVLAIILISMIGFVGVYKQNQNRAENIIKGYDLAMNLEGARVISIKPEENIITVIKDNEGNTVEDAGELTDEEIKSKGYTKEEVNQNADKLTNENFQKAKDIVEKRLKNMGLEDYTIRLNEETGEIVIEIEENENTDTIVSNLGTTGKFEIQDSETSEVLMNNDDIKEVNVMYGAEDNGTGVYLEIVFNKDGKSKLENITNTYITKDTNTTDTNTTSDTNATDTNTTSDDSKSEEDKKEEEQKKVTMKIDDETIMTTSFDNVIRTGKMQLTVGKTSSSKEIVNENAKRAGNVASVLSYGNLPVDYEITGNEYILSEITNKDFQIAIIAIVSIVGVLLLILIFKYKLLGLLSAISYIGFVALYLILIRYTNSIISIEGVVGIISILIANYVFTRKLLASERKENFTKAVQSVYGDFWLKMLPICIITVVFCFIRWIPVSSFGMTMLWGIILMLVYHLVITVPLIKWKEEK